ncbi:inositol oxygenase [Melampsora americana]|nr:inositol oxygenase [Melampsora americana]
MTDQLNPLPLTMEDEVDKVNLLKIEITQNSTLSTDSDPQHQQLQKSFRDYEKACDRVKNFYEEQHTHQTFEFNLQVRERFKKREKRKMRMFEALDLLDGLVDQSDPDMELGQLDHLLQTAEAIRRDGKPDWMQVVGLIHDLGKLMHLFRPEGEESRQWDVVGDTFVVGAKFSDKIIYPDTFSKNPDWNDPVYSSEYGVYEPNCGMENVLLSWGHDEYLYNVLKDKCLLPKEEMEHYRQFMKEGDQKLLEAVIEFNPYDLYSKSTIRPDPVKLRPYYQSILEKYFPEPIEF